MFSASCSSCSDEEHVLCNTGSELILVSPDLLAEVGFGVLAELAFPALGNIERDDRVSWGQGNHDDSISNHDNNTDHCFEVIGRMSADLL